MLLSKAFQICSTNRESGEQWWRGGERIRSYVEDYLVEPIQGTILCYVVRCELRHWRGGKAGAMPLNGAVPISTQQKGVIMSMVKLLLVLNKLSKYKENQTTYLRRKCSCQVDCHAGSGSAKYRRRQNHLTTLVRKRLSVEYGYQSDINAGICQKMWRPLSLLHRRSDSGIS